MITIWLFADGIYGVHEEGQYFAYQPDKEHALIFAAYLSKVTGQSIKNNFYIGDGYSQMSLKWLSKE